MFVGSIETIPPVVENHSKPSDVSIAEGCGRSGTAAPGTPSRWSKVSWLTRWLGSRISRSTSGRTTRVMPSTPFSQRSPSCVRTMPETPRNVAPAALLTGTKRSRSKRDNPCSPPTQAPSPSVRIAKTLPTSSPFCLPNSCTARPSTRAMRSFGVTEPNPLARVRRCNERVLLRQSVEVAVRLPLAVDNAIGASTAQRSPKRTVTVAREKLNRTAQYIRGQGVTDDPSALEPAERSRSPEPNGSVEVSMRSSEKRRALPIYDCPAANQTDVSLGGIAAGNPERSGVCGDERGGREVVLHARRCSIANDVGAAEPMQTGAGADPNVDARDPDKSRTRDRSAHRRSRTSPVRFAANGLP